MSMHYNLSLLVNNLNTNFKDTLQSIFNDNSDYITKLEEYLNQQSADFEGLAEIYPPKNLIFNAFNYFNMDELKVVIIGQDPYHGPNQAMGLCFSVPDGQKIPPSLVNINKELSSDLGLDISGRNGDLTNWANQGVLLLNTALTVRQSKANSHSKIWSQFTKLILKKISEDTDGIIFILWGGHAKGFKKLIQESNNNHYFIESHHPSPLSANRGGWFGSKPFSKANEYLESTGKITIEW